MNNPAKIKSLFLSDFIAKYTKINKNGRDNNSVVGYSQK